MFHLDMSGAEVDAATKSVYTTDAKGANLSIWPMADEGLKVSVISGQEKPIVQGWMPAGNYKCRPIPTPVFEKQQAAKASFAYVFYPTPEGVKCPIVKVEPVSVQGSQGGGCHGYQVRGWTGGLLRARREERPADPIRQVRQQCASDVYSDGEGAPRQLP